MASSAIQEQPSSHGFDFSNHGRNQFLGARMGGLPKGMFSWLRFEESETDDTATSTGTTIVGVKFGGGSSGEEEGVCLGADTRATGGSIVADKNCEKVSFGSLWLRPS
jgi:20S proteasome subunit beta 2